MSFDNLDRWRNHPRTRTTFRSAVPGLATGLSLFALSVLIEDVPRLFHSEGSKSSHQH
jgi:hypothetical protein